MKKKLQCVPSRKQSQWHYWKNQLRGDFVSALYSALTPETDLKRKGKKQQQQLQKRREQKIPSQPQKTTLVRHLLQPLIFTQDSKREMGNLTDFSVVEKCPTKINQSRSILYIGCKWKSIPASFQDWPLPLMAQCHQTDQCPEKQHIDVTTDIQYNQQLFFEISKIFCHYSPRLKRTVVLVYTHEVISTTLDLNADLQQKTIQSRLN